MGTCCEKCANAINSAGCYCDCHAPTPNTGTEWAEIREIIKLIGYEGGNTGAADKATDKIIKYYATQKSLIIAEVEKIDKQEPEDSPYRRNPGMPQHSPDTLTTAYRKGFHAALNALLAKLKGM